MPASTKTPALETAEAEALETGPVTPAAPQTPKARTYRCGKGHQWQAVHDGGEALPGSIVFHTPETATTPPLCLSCLMIWAVRNLAIVTDITPE